MKKPALRAAFFGFANALLRPFRLKLMSRGTPTRGFVDFFRHVKSQGIEFATVIDVGVARGTPELYSEFARAKFYLIEPVPACKPILARIARSLNAEVFSVAAGAEDGVLEFFVHGDISGSSRFRQWEGELLDGKREQVPVRRLDSLVNGEVARPCLLKIDTQGAELEVLAGAGRLLDSIDMIIVEVSFHQFRKGAPEFNEIVAQIDRLGYRCYEVVDGHFRLVDGALAQVDLVFVRDDSPLREYKGFFSADQARAYAGSGA